MSGGFFRGTSADQDTRFSNKQAKLLKSQKFAPVLDHLIDTTKVKMDVIRPWIATRATELLGFEDEVLINFVYGLLDGKEVDGKQIQIQLTGFMEKNTGKFMKDLWILLLSAQNNVSGVPQQFLDAKEEETKKKKAETDRITQEIQKRRDRDGREPQRERKSRFDGEVDVSKFTKVDSDSKFSKPKASSVPPDPATEEEMTHGSRVKDGRSSSPPPNNRSPSPRMIPSPTRSNDKSISRSRSHSQERHISRSLSVSSRSPRHSISPRRHYQSPERRSFSPKRRYRSPPKCFVSPRRGYSPRDSRSPLRQRSPHRRRRSRSRHRSPSPFRYGSPHARRRSPRRRSPSPLCHRSPSPLRRRFPFPLRRRSPSPFRRRSPPLHRRSPSPLQCISPSPSRRRSPIKDRRRSPSPLQQKSPIRRRSPRAKYGSPSPLRRSPVSRSPNHRRFPSPLRHRSPSPFRRRSPPLHRRSPPLQCRSPSPSRRRFPIKDRRRSPSPLRQRSPIRRRSPPAKNRSPSPLRSPESRSPNRQRQTPLHSLRSRPADSPPQRRSRSPYGGRSPSHQTRRSLSRERDSRVNNNESRRYRDEKIFTRDDAKNSLANHASERELDRRTSSKHKVPASESRNVLVSSRSPQHDVRNQSGDRKKKPAVSPENSPSHSESPSDMQKVNSRTRRRSRSLSKSPIRKKIIRSSRHDSPGTDEEEERIPRTREVSHHRTDSSRRRSKDLSKDVKPKRREFSQSPAPSGLQLSSELKKKDSKQGSDMVVHEEPAQQLPNSSKGDYMSRSLQDEHGPGDHIHDRRQSAKLLKRDASFDRREHHEQAVNDQRKHQRGGDEYSEVMNNSEMEPVKSKKKKDDMEIRNHLNTKNSDPEETDSYGNDKIAKRRYKKSDKRKRDYDGTSESDSQIDDKREAKRKKKDEKRRRKEEKRRRREERHRRKLERRSGKLKMKSIGATSPPSDFEKVHSDADGSNDDTRRRKNSYTRDADETESEQKRLEIELREKALESLRAKKAISH